MKCTHGGALERVGIAAEHSILQNSARVSTGFDTADAGRICAADLIATVSTNAARGIPVRGVHDRLYFPAADPNVLKHAIV